MTLRADEAIHCLRGAPAFTVIRSALAVSSHELFRILQFSVQDDHIHLIVEAESRLSLSRGVQGLAIRVARAVNRALGRRGRVWGDRFHARPLTTPRAVRHALVYVLTNFRKHGRHGGETDPCSSAAWFDGWRNRLAARRPDASPIATPHTWLARIGWRRHGLIDVRDAPAPSRRRSHRRDPGR